jgi:hypothetical protein
LYLGSGPQAVATTGTNVIGGLISGTYLITTTSAFEQLSIRNVSPTAVVTSTTAGGAEQTHNHIVIMRIA